MSVILNVNEEILRDSKMGIKIFIYKLFEITLAGQSGEFLGTTMALGMSVHNVAILCPTLM